MNLYSRNIVMGLSQHAEFYEAKHGMLNAPVYRQVDVRAPALKPFTGAASPWWGDYEMNTYAVPETIRQNKRANLEAGEDVLDISIGYPKIQVVNYKAENKFIIYASEQVSATGLAPGRQQSAHFISGPILSVIEGVKSVQLLGPEYAPGAQTGFSGQAGRVGKRIAGSPFPDVRRMIESDKPVTLEVTCQDGSHHRVVIKNKKVMMHIDNREMGRNNAFYGNSKGAEVLNKGKVLQDFADVNTYSYNGTYTGVFSSPTGRREPQLVTDNQENLPLAPIITPAPGQWPEITEAYQRVIREITQLGQSTLFGRNILARVLLNPALNATTKTAMIMLSHQIASNFTRANISAFGTAVPVVASIGTPQFWAGIFALVVIQNLADKALRKVLAPLVPKELLSDDNFLTRHLTRVLGNCSIEFARLMINHSILFATGFKKHHIEIPVHLAQASTYAVIREARRQYGDRRSYPLTHAIFDLLQFTNDVAWRSLGNTLAYQQTAPSPPADTPDSNAVSPEVAGSGASGSGMIEPSTGEAMANSDPPLAGTGEAYLQALAQRTSVRVTDKLFFPTLAQLSDHIKPADGKGPVADQFKRIYRDKLPLSNKLSSASVWIDEKSYKYTPEMYKHLWFHAPSYGARMNRVWLLFRMHLKLAACCSRGNSLLTPQDRDIAALLDTYADASDEQKSEFMATRGKEVEALLERISYEKQVLDPQQQKFFQRYTQMLGVNTEPSRSGGTAGGTSAPVDSDPVLESSGEPLQPVNTPPASSRPSRPFDRGPALGPLYKESAFLEPDKRDGSVHKKDTTFSDRYQVNIMEMQSRMRAAASLEEDINTHFPGPEHSHFREELRRAISSYTVESGFFHLPLRYAHTGQPRWIEAVRGIKIPYTVLNTPNNVTDEFTEQVDPIGAMYINLALRDAAKFSFPVIRGVHTVAGYRSDTQPSTPGAGVFDIEPTDISTGDIVMNTEMLSTSTSDTMGKNFSMAIDMGMTDTRRRLKYVIEGDTAVNITQHTDLNQAEAIYTPGAQFKVTGISGTPEDLGLVVRAKQINTYEEWELGEGKEGIKMKDPATGRLSRAGKFFAPRNYFLGHCVTSEKQEDYGPSRWLRPFDAPNTPRGIRDAIHAAFLREDDLLRAAPGDRLERSYLDLATENIHHEHYRNRAVTRAREQVQKYFPELISGNDIPDLTELQERREEDSGPSGRESPLASAAQAGSDARRLREAELDQAQRVFEHEKHREAEIRDTHVKAGTLATWFAHNDNNSDRSLM